MARFQIRGLIVAARLPETAFEMFECRMQQTQQSESSPDFRRPPLGFLPATGIQMAAVEALPAHIKVETQHEITTQVEADSLEDALVAAGDRFGRVLAAIAFSSNPLVQGMVVITHWKELAADGSVARAGEAVTSMVFEPVLGGPLDAPTEVRIRV